jgi:mono/diheme cytochrome c family protein
MSLGRVVGAVQWIVGVAAATCVVMLFTLGGAENPVASDYGDDASRTADEALDPAVLEAGGELYTSHCAACHGREGQGGTGPRLAGTVVTLYPAVADQIRIVADGRNGMRAFGGRLTDEEIAAVVAFTREGL